MYAKEYILFFIRFAFQINRKGKQITYFSDTVLRKSKCQKEIKSKEYKFFQLKFSISSHHITTWIFYLNFYKIKSIISKQFE